MMLRRPVVGCALYERQNVGSFSMFSSKFQYHRPEKAQKNFSEAFGGTITLWRIRKSKMMWHTKSFGDYTKNFILEMGGSIGHEL